MQPRQPRAGDAVWVKPALVALFQVSVVHAVRPSIPALQAHALDDVIVEQDQGVGLQPRGAHRSVIHARLAVVGEVVAQLVRAPGVRIRVFVLLLLLLTVIEIGVNRRISDFIG